MPDKIFRLRTGPGNKMGAFGRDGQVIAPEFAKTGPRDVAHGPELFDVFYIKFEDNLSVKSISTCLYNFLSMSQASMFSNKASISKKDDDFGKLHFFQTSTILS
jgi:hypothetical protein